MIRKKLSIVLILSTGAFLHAETAKVDFVTEVKPIFEAACIGCHGAKKDKGDYRMDTKELAFKGGENFEKDCIILGNAEDSQVYFSVTLPKDDDEVMPPGKDALLTKAQQETIKNWIDQGANWPDGVVLKQTQRLNFDKHILSILRKGGPFSAKDKQKLRLWTLQGSVWPDGFSIGDAGDEGSGGPSDNLDLIVKMREAIAEGSPEKAFAEMKEYESTIPKTGAKYQMVPVPGGEFLMGSPAGEADRLDDEGPQHKVKIDPFWMGKFEVTWDMYEPFMITATPRNKDGSPIKIEADDEVVDIVSSPTAPYTEMSFGMGLDGFPAISMTQHAANKFCQWLSAQTGHFYRLPTEAEWEYACRAGSDGPFSCSEAELPEYSVFETRPDDPLLVGYARIGTKKPNPFGLHDMHGNVMEWCIDQYFADSYASRSGSGNTVISPFTKPTSLYPRVARGGSWYDPACDVRSARRWASEENWKQQDPQLPKSIWYHTDALWLGFRLVRPLKVPDAQKMDAMWNLGRAGE